MGELEKYGLLSLASVAALFLVLTFAHRDLGPEQVTGSQHELQLASVDRFERTARAQERRPDERPGARPPVAVAEPDPASPVRAAVDPELEDSFYRVRKGDSFWTIAQRTLGAGRRWPELVAANRRLDPRRLKVGQLIRIPRDRARSESVGSASPARRSQSEEEQLRRLPRRVAPSSNRHVVEPGDTLSEIALEYYQDAMEWKRIYQANRKRIRNARQLEVGTILELP